MPPLLHKISPTEPGAATGPLVLADRAAYSIAAEQAEAVFALEDMAPSAQDKAITAAILAGKVSPEQAREELREYVIAHKSVAGFLESRSWGR
ncbi:hypothetical protein EIP75_21530 [Aquabacterium soli]|uniref:Antitoxin VbhA domain-containing protein n=1 Tax=Aquabacterium soli TaxID=2493092 RepID=A0A3R8T213_9BURK|nr:antitoxin VbhA family protein [Aquabacterium soli]RRS01160.1 hypothetical protein EIP75_21530 [Aquabacterium soli]